MCQLDKIDPLHEHVLGNARTYQFVMFWTSYASCRGTNVSVRAVFFLQFWWKTGGGHFHCGFHHPRRTVTFGTCTVSSIGRIRSSTLVAPSSSDPIAFLLASSPAFAIPVLLLAIGAIGTTLLGSFLAMGYFAVDMMMMSHTMNQLPNNKGGDDDNDSITRHTTPPKWKRQTAQCLAVCIPCALAYSFDGDICQSVKC